MAGGDGASAYRRPKPHIKAKVSVGAPTGQLGQVNLPGFLPWAAFGWIDTLEHVPELVWPTSVRTYNYMRTDSQVGGLYLGVTLPIRRYKYAVAPNGARDEVVQQVSEDFNLPIQGGDEKPSQTTAVDAFSWDEFLRTALLALCYGFYHFEIDGEIKAGQWHMKNLCPRPPSTITQVDVAADGSLVSIKQAVGTNAPVISANRLVPFCWDKEGGNWFGRSLFRTMYKNWLLKDRLLRVDAMRHDRNGLGVPIVEAPPGAGAMQLEYLNQLAQNFRAGDMSGAAVPNGAKLTLVGTTGSVSDILGSIGMHDEAMARALLMMFMQLGQTMHGSRALGDSFLDYFSLAQETIALWVEDTVAKYAINSIVSYNWGEDEPAPRITHERNPEPDLAVADLDLLIKDGAIKVDPDFEVFVRSRFMLPAPNPEEPEEPEPIPITLQLPPGAPVPGVPSEGAPAAPEEASPATPSQPVKARRKRTVAAVVGTPSLLPLPNRPLRRQPYEQEVRASVDYAAMDQDYKTARTALVADVSTQQAAQVAELCDKIKAAKGSLKALAKLAATPIHADTILARLTQMATAGANQAVTEAARQGVTVAMPDMDKAMLSLQNRAVATDSLLARSISETAGRKALSLTGPAAMTPEIVADSVKTYLGGLSTSYLSDQLGGALQAAMNTGRRAVFEESNPSEIYASELLDDGTCDPCADVDGTEYTDLDAAEADYPTGGYMDCLGGPRCRGTLIATYGEVDS